MAKNIGDFITSKAFADGAARVVRDAIAKTESLGLPCAYDPAPKMPAQPEVVRIAVVPSKKKTYQLA